MEIKCEKTFLFLIKLLLQTGDENFFIMTYWEILGSKYGGCRSLLEGEERNDESMWRRHIRKICGRQSEENWFNKFIKWKMGDGQNIRFWEDSWLGEQSLANRFPRLYLNSNK